MAYLFVFGATTPQWVRASSFTRLLDHTQRLTTVGRGLLWTSDQPNADLTTHDIHNIQTSKPPGGIRSHNLSRLESPQTYALDRAATGTAIYDYNNLKIFKLSF